MYLINHLPIYIVRLDRLDPVRDTVRTAGNVPALPARLNSADTTKYRKSISEISHLL
jgi:hypothetical protein